MPPYQVDNRMISNVDFEKYFSKLLLIPRKNINYSKEPSVFDARLGAEARRSFGIRLRREMQRYANAKSDKASHEKIRLDE